MEEVIPLCISQKVSEESSSTLNDIFNNPVKDIEAYLEMVMVEMTAVAEGFLTSCEGCYTLEGDAQLILRAKSISNRLNSRVDEYFFFKN